jgi:hypothetical protein
LHYPVGFNGFTAAMFRIEHVKTFHIKFTGTIYNYDLAPNKIPHDTLAMAMNPKAKHSLYTVAMLLFYIL